MRINPPSGQKLVCLNLCSRGVEGGMEGVVVAGERFDSSVNTGFALGENQNSKRVMYHNVHCSTIYNSQDMEAT